MDESLGHSATAQRDKHHLSRAHCAMLLNRLIENLFWVGRETFKSCAYRYWCVTFTVTSPISVGMDWDEESLGYTQHNICQLMEGGLVVQPYLLKICWGMVKKYDWILNTFPLYQSIPTRFFGSVSLIGWLCHRQVNLLMGSAKSGSEPDYLLTKRQHLLLIWVKGFHPRLWQSSLSLLSRRPLARPQPVTVTKVKAGRPLN